MDGTADVTHRGGVITVVTDQGRVGAARAQGVEALLRATVYLQVGGFAPVATGEDVAVVHAIVAAGGIRAAIAGAPVLTSGQHVGRAPHGMADYLRRLASTASRDETVA